MRFGIVCCELEDCMTMRQQVEETIEVIRPALQADGGDIILREVDEATGVSHSHVDRRMHHMSSLRS